MTLRRGGSRKRFFRALTTELSLDTARAMLVGITLPFTRGAYAKRRGTSLLRGAIARNDASLVTFLVAQGARPPADAFGPEHTPLEAHYLGQFYAVGGPLYRPSKDARFGALPEASVGEIKAEASRALRRYDRRLCRRRGRAAARAFRARRLLGASMAAWSRTALDERAAREAAAVDDAWDEVD